MKNSKVEDFKLKKLRMKFLLNIKNFKTLKKAQKITKKTKIIRIKGKDSKKIYYYNQS